MRYAFSISNGIEGIGELAIKHNMWIELWYTGGKPSNFIYKSASPELIESVTVTPEQEVPQSIR